MEQPFLISLKSGMLWMEKLTRKENGLVQVKLFLLLEAA
jgi:hypothetical protein